MERIAYMVLFFFFVVVEDNRLVGRKDILSYLRKEDEF